MLPPLPLPFLPLNPLPRNRYRRAIKVPSRLDTKPLEERRRQIRMHRDQAVDRPILLHPGPPHNQRDVDVLLVPAALPRLQPMLPDVEPVVAAVDHVRILQDPMVRQPLDEPRDELVDGLQGAQALSVEVVVIRDVGRVLLREGVDPVRARRLLRVEVPRPRHRLPLKQAPVPLRGDWLRKQDRAEVVAARVLLPLFARHHDVGVRCDWCRDEEERLRGCDGLVEEAVGFLCQHVGAVLALVAARGLAVALERAVEIIVGVWVQEEVLGWV